MFTRRLAFTESAESAQSAIRTFSKREKKGDGIFGFIFVGDRVFGFGVFLRGAGTSRRQVGKEARGTQ